ncbi:hypothetical protein GCM10008959_27100 [Deinococcus seoulensis]|uniref:Uncharacterized protein n=1 Tax=Deinococcus seoulensis TaxID=1837379 RepID=A0ABQ2RUK1_9DEIO|nr:hypothetical protein GCM10008959_27100 [Deinococcus seoulensis]
MAGACADLLSGGQKLGHEFAPDVTGGGCDENHALTVGPPRPVVAFPEGLLKRRPGGAGRAGKSCHDSPLGCLTDPSHADDEKLMGRA